MARRLFFALWLPDPAADDLSRAVAPLQAAGPHWMRWQPRERWHVTMCFLGERDDDQLERIRGSGSAAAAAAVAEPVRLSGSGRFGNVLWVGIDDGDWLKRLARRLNREFVPHDERRPFHGHVTVARSRGRGMDQASRQGLAEYQGPRWTPDHLSLVASELGPNPRYTDLHRWPLAGNG